MLASEVAMHAYIVFGHPPKRSFTDAVLQALVEYEREMNMRGDRA